MRQLIAGEIRDGHSPIKISISQNTKNHIFILTQVELGSNYFWIKRVSRFQMQRFTQPTHKNNMRMICFSDNQVVYDYQDPKMFDGGPTSKPLVHIQQRIYNLEGYCTCQMQYKSTSYKFKVNRYLPNLDSSIQNFSHDPFFIYLGNRSLPGP